MRCVAQSRDEDLREKGGYRLRAAARRIGIALGAKIGAVLGQTTAGLSRFLIAHALQRTGKTAQIVRTEVRIEDIGIAMDSSREVIFNLATARTVLDLASIDTRRPHRARRIEHVSRPRGPAGADRAAFAQGSSQGERKSRASVRKRDVTVTVEDGKNQTIVEERMDSELERE